MSHTVSYTYYVTSPTRILKAGEISSVSAFDVFIVRKLYFLSVQLSVMLRYANAIVLIVGFSEILPLFTTLYRILPHLFFYFNLF